MANRAGLANGTTGPAYGEAACLLRHCSCVGPTPPGIHAAFTLLSLLAQRPLSLYAAWPNNSCTAVHACGPCHQFGARCRMREVVDIAELEDGEPLGTVSAVARDVSCNRLSERDGPQLLHLSVAAPHACRSTAATVCCNSLQTGNLYNWHTQPHI